MFPNRKFDLVPVLAEHEQLESGMVPYAYRTDVIDTSQEFCRNVYGHVMNDIALINEQTNLDLAVSLANKLLQQRPSDGVTDDSVSNEELLMSLKSRYRQSPSEIISYIETQLEFQFDRDSVHYQDEQSIKEHEDRMKRLQEIRESLSSQERDAYLQRKRDREIDELIDG